MFEVPVQLMVALAIGASASPLAPSDARLAPLARIEQARAPGPARAAADAVGPYLFRDEIWLQSIRRIEGLGVASHVFTTSTGRAYVPNAEHRARLLALRTDMGLAEALAIDTARRNAIALAGMIGRMPTAGELLIAHLFGAAKASLVISAAARAPATRIDAVAGLLTVES